MRLFALSLLLLAGACAGAPPSAAPPATPAPVASGALTDTDWTIAEAGGQAVPEPARATLRIAGGRAAGRAVCNRFMGPVVLDGASLRFDALATTRMACPPALIEAERRILRAFAAARSWRAEDDGAVLLDERGGAVMRLRR